MDHYQITSTVLQNTLGSALARDVNINDVAKGLRDVLPSAAKVDHVASPTRPTRVARFICLML